LIRAVAYFNFGFVNDGENIAPVLNPPTEKVEASPDAILMVVGMHLISRLKTSKVHHGDGKASASNCYVPDATAHALSLPRIGEEFGKDHTTVLYSCDKITQLQKSDLTWQTLLSERSLTWLAARKILIIKPSSSEPAVLQALF